MEGLSNRLDDYAPGGASAPPPPPKPGTAAAATMQTQQQLQSDKAKASAHILSERATAKPNLKPLNTAQCTSIIDAMKEGAWRGVQRCLFFTARGTHVLLCRCAVYKAKVKPFEEAFKFGNFFSPLLTDADFDGKPQVMLLGQYSTGKTTFIRHLLGREYPGHACHGC